MWEDRTLSLLHWLHPSVCVSVCVYVCLLCYIALHRQKGVGGIALYTFSRSRYVGGGGVRRTHTLFLLASLVFRRASPWCALPSYCLTFMNGSSADGKCHPTFLRLQLLGLFLHTIAWTCHRGQFRAIAPLQRSGASRRGVNQLWGGVGEGGGLFAYLDVSWVRRFTDRYRDAGLYMKRNVSCYLPPDSRTALPVLSLSLYF